MPLPALLTWALPLLILCWMVGAYNRLVRLRASALQAFGALENCYVQHTALIAAADAATTPAQLRAAADQFSAALASARSEPLRSDTVAALGAARDVLAATWTASPVAELETRWGAIAQLQADALLRFNASATAYGHAVRQFPALLVAGLFGFKPTRTL